ncbi:MAG TPA: DUF1566 domain-containing protein [Arcobacter sp.]|nr:DUF1566 domain-containing protein [Arcobacter sp.]
MLKLLLILTININLFALSDEVKFDMLKIKLAKQFENKEFKKSLNTMQAIKELNIKIPDSFIFFEAKALYNSNSELNSYNKFKYYAETYGRDSQYYTQTLNYLLILEEKIQYNKLLKQKEKKEFNSVYRDKETMLMWQDNPESANQKNDKYWKDAKKYCDKLILHNYKDWYLPNRDQLVNLNKNYHNLKFNSKYSYWSSTLNKSDKTQACLIRTHSLRYDYKISNKYAVRCVRDM